MKPSSFASWCRRFRRRRRRPRRSGPPIRVSRLPRPNSMSEAVTAPQAAPSVRLGLKENWPQFVLLLLINAFVGGMVGIERTVVPLIGAEEFKIGSTTLVVSFIVSFGVVKACANLISGQLADAWGRKRVLILGWLVGLPAPFLIIRAPSWSWGIAAHELLGIDPGFARSMAVVI